MTPELAHALYRGRWDYFLERGVLEHEVTLVDYLERQCGDP
ncbi:protein of unknown function [Thauera humireducens]|nr:hypothetical protein [Thauera humireducens]CAH1748175.1 protein of unknown function [Thauera humireducens]